MIILLKLIFLSLAILFSINNIFRDKVNIDVPIWCFLFQFFGIMGFIFLQWFYN